MTERQCIATMDDLICRAFSMMEEIDLFPDDVVVERCRDAQLLIKTAKTLSAAFDARKNILEFYAAEDERQGEAS